MLRRCLELFAILVPILAVAIPAHAEPRQRLVIAFQPGASDISVLGIPENGDGLEKMAAVLTRHGIRPELEFLLMAGPDPDCVKGTSCSPKESRRKRVATVVWGLKGKSVPRAALDRLKWAPAERGARETQGSVELVVREAPRTPQSCPWTIQVRDPGLPPDPDGRVLEYVARNGLWLDSADSLRLVPSVSGAVSYGLALIVDRSGGPGRFAVFDPIHNARAEHSIDVGRVGGIRLLAFNVAGDIPSDIKNDIGPVTAARDQARDVGEGLLPPASPAASAPDWPRPELAKRATSICDFPVR